MSVDASKKEKSKVEFITNGQNLLIDIGNWVDSQKDVGKTTGLDHFFNLASQAYICMSFANSVRIVDVDTYASRLDNFRKAKSYYRALREYLTVIGAMYQIKKSRKKDWNNCLYFVDIEIDGVIKSDLKVFQKAVGKFNKTANILNKMLEGVITIKEIEGSYISWRGFAKQFDSYDTIQRMNQLFEELFGYIPVDNKTRKKKKKRKIERRINELYKMAEQNAFPVRR